MFNQAHTAAGEPFLADHHRILDGLFEAVVAQAHDGDPVRLREQWSLFEQELLRHMETEETILLPVFAHRHRRECQQIRAEHDEIRKVLLELGVSLDLHLLRADLVQAFVARLRTHARHEEGVLYPWAERALGPAAWRRILERA